MEAMGGSRIKYHIRVANMFSRAAHQVTPEFPTNLRKSKKNMRQIYCRS
jgi:hypothetical protein